MDGNLAYLFWQKSTVDGLDDAHYRYSLPKELIDAVLTTGTQYPVGTMYLYNQSTGTVIEDVVFTRPADGNIRPWVIQVSSATFDFSTESTASETEASYSSGNLTLMTCGSPAARSIWSIATAFLRHRHDNSNGSLDAQVKHSSLLNLDPPSDSTDTHNGRYPSGVPRWTASRWIQDDHVSLLSRVGAQTVTAEERDPNNNAMLGHLLIANTTDTGGDNVFTYTPTVATYNIYFGDTDGDYITNVAGGIEAHANSGSINFGFKGYGDGAGTGLIGSGGSNSGLGVSGTGGSSNGPGGDFVGTGTGRGARGVGGNSSGTGLYGTSLGLGHGIHGDAGVGGYGVVAEGHLSGGISGASALRVIPQTTEPSLSAAKGDIYFNSTTNVASGHNGTIWKNLGAHNIVHMSTTQSSITTSSSETLLDSYTVPLNSLAAGTVFRIHAMVRIGKEDVNNNSSQIRIRYGWVSSGTPGEQLINLALVPNDVFVVDEIAMITTEVVFLGAGASIDWVAIGHSTNSWDTVAASGGEQASTSDASTGTEEGTLDNTSGSQVLALTYDRTFSSGLGARSSMFYVEILH